MPPLSPLRGLIMVLGALPLLLGITLFVVMYVFLDRSQADWASLSAEAQQAWSRRWNRRIRRYAAFLVCALAWALGGFVVRLAVVPFR